MLRQTVISALAPEIRVSCQILVLGSMPGAISQKEAEYYAHPRNLFWDCVETAFQIDRNAPYQARLAALNDAHIGLWDVLASCSRKASSDATIRDAKCNDFVKLFSAYPQINRICLNGRTAFDYWRRLVIPSFADELDKELIADVEIIGLPSTSPAHAALSPAAKIDAWCAALSRGWLEIRTGDFQVYRAVLKHWNGDKNLLPLILLAWLKAVVDIKIEPMSKLMKISEFTDDQSDQVIALWEKCGLARSWNNPEKDIARKNSDQNGKFLIGQIDGVLMASIMIGYDGHRGSINFLAVDPDYARTGYGKILMAEAERFLLSVGCPKINFCVRTDNAKVVEFYQQLGYAIEPVHLLGKRLIKDD